MPRKARLADRAADVEEYLRSAGGSMPTPQLETHVRQGGLDGLRAVLKKNSITVRGFLRLYPETFTTRGGVVKIRDAPAATPTAPAAPAAEPDPPPAALAGSSGDPLPGSAGFEALPLNRRMAIVAAREAARREERQRRQRERVSAVRSIYGAGPR